LTRRISASMGFDRGRSRKVDDRSNAVGERAAIEFGSDIRDEDLFQLGRTAPAGSAALRGADRVRRASSSRQRAVPTKPDAR